MKRLLVLLIIILVRPSLHSQNPEASATLQQIRSQIALRNLSERGLRNDASWATFEPIAPRPPETIGNTYLDSEFHTGNVILLNKERMLENFRMRYDIHRDEMEFETPSGVRVLQGAKIKSFVLFNSSGDGYRYFVRGSVIASNARTIHDGFFEVLNEGTQPLLKISTVLVKEADFRVDLSVGTRDNRIVKKEEYFLLKSRQLVGVPKKKKQVFALFGKHDTRVASFADENDLSPGREDDLIRIVNYYNTLL